MKGIIKRKLNQIKLLNNQVNKESDWVNTLVRINSINNQVDKLLGYKVVLKLGEKK